MAKCVLLLYNVMEHAKQDKEMDGGGERGRKEGQIVLRKQRRGRDRGGEKGEEMGEKWIEKEEWRQRRRRINHNKNK